MRRTGIANAPKKNACGDGQEQARCRQESLNHEEDDEDQSAMSASSVLARGGEVLGDGRDRDCGTHAVGTTPSGRTRGPVAGAEVPLDTAPSRRSGRCRGLSEALKGEAWRAGLGQSVARVEAPPVPNDPAKADVGRRRCFFAVRQIRKVLRATDDDTTCRGLGSAPSTHRDPVALRCQGAKIEPVSRHAAADWHSVEKPGPEALRINGIRDQRARRTDVDVVGRHGPGHVVGQCRSAGSRRSGRPELQND